MKRKLTKFIIVVTSILIAELVRDFAIHMFREYIHLGDPYTSTLFGMAVLVIVLYPTLVFVEEYSKWMAKKYVKASKNTFGPSLSAVFIAFLILFFLLFAGYLYVWYHVNIFKQV